MKFIHAADVHLDSPLRGLEEYSGAPVKRLQMATRRALDNVVQLCLDEQVDFLLIAGDLFDTACHDFNAALAAANQMQPLQRANIKVYVILGNHDSHFEITRKVPWPANVVVFDHKQPHTVQHPDLPVAIHGMSYPQRVVKQNLVPDYPAPIPQRLNIGMLHTNAGANPNYDDYAPCSVEELVTKGYDYWALGHVHDYQQLSARPPILYSGNTQGRHAREIGAKGCVLVTTDDKEVLSWEFRETDVARWYHTIVQLEKDDDEDALLERTRHALREVLASAGNRLAAVRLEYAGRCAIHQELIRETARQQIMTNVRALAGDFGDDVWIEKIKFHTQSTLNVDALRQGHDLLGELLREIKSLEADPARLVSLGEILRPLAAKAGPELQVEQDRADRVEFDNPAQLSAWLREAEELLLSRLVEERV